MNYIDRLIEKSTRRKKKYTKKLYDNIIKQRSETKAGRKILKRRNRNTKSFPLFKIYIIFLETDL